MCTKQKLYGQLPVVNRMPAEKSLRPLSAKQVQLATDCLRVLANRRDVSIGEMSHEIRSKNLYPRFYSYLRRSPRISKMQFVNEMQKLI